MPEFKIDYEYEQGPSHHDPDYMTPDAQMQTFKGSCTIDAADRDEAEKKFKADKSYAKITGIEEVSG